MIKTFLYGALLVTVALFLIAAPRPDFLGTHLRENNEVIGQLPEFQIEWNRGEKIATTDGAPGFGNPWSDLLNIEFALRPRRFANLLHFVAVPQSQSEYTLPIEPGEAGREAERILGAIAAWVTNIVRDNPSAPQLSVVAPVKAFEIDNRVIVEFRNASLVFNDGASVAIGDVEVAITPLDGGFYDFSVNLPTRLEFKDTEDIVVGVATFAEPKLSGTWWQIHDVPTAFVARFKDFKLFDFLEKGLAGSPFFSMRELAVEHSLARDDEGLWQGRSVAKIIGIRERKRTNVSAGEVALTVAFTDFAFDEWRQVVERFELDDSQSSPRFSREQAEALAEAISSVRWGDASVEFVLSNFQYSDEFQTDVNFSRFSFGFGTQATKGVANLKLDLRLDDLSIADTDVPKQLLPNLADVQLRLEGVPLALAVVPRIALVEGIELDPLLGAAFDVLANMAPEDAITLVLEKLAYRANLFGASADGSVELDLESSNLGLGGFAVSVEDLKQLAEFAALAEGRGERWANGVPSCLAQLQELGEVSADASKERHFFQIDIPASQPPTVNGQPLSVIGRACDFSSDQPRVETAPTAPAPHMGSYCYRLETNEMFELRGDACAEDAFEMSTSEFKNWQADRTAFKSVFELLQKPRAEK